MSKNSVLPGATIGLLGGGQLGRMLALAARKLGFRVHTFEPLADSPAGQVSDREFNAAYENFSQLDDFCQSVDVATFEFENIPAAIVERIALFKPVHPHSSVLHICQNREREKKFLLEKGYPVAQFRLLHSADDLAKALSEITGDIVLKTADFGYDGKGQLKVDRQLSAEGSWQQFGSEKAVLEQWISHLCEISVIVARDANGASITFPAAENRHRHHVLDISIVPARIAPEIQKKAAALAVSIAQDLGLVGLLAVEFFVSDNGELLINELAPRPHNSGHYTVDACVTSQFEQHLRAICGWPFGSTRLLTPVVMVNLLGDLWKNGQPPNLTPILSEPDAKLHLYGKREGRPGRKMGHFCVLKPTIEEALATAQEILQKLFR